MKKYLLIIGFLLTSFVSFSQVIPKPNPTAVGIGYKRLLADSTIFIPTGGAIPRLGSNNINRRSAIYADTINKKLWVFYPNDSTWKESGVTKINWDSVFNKPIYFKTKYDSSTDIKDSIQARLAIRDTATMLAPYVRTGVLAGYVPNTRSLTINGVAQNLSTDRIWSIAPGGVSGQILSKNSNTDYDYGWIDNFADWTSTVKEYVKVGQDITKGQAVYVSSSDGTNIIVSKASNVSEATSSKVIGLLAQTLSTNGKGYVITEGLLSGLNTASATTGDPVWLGVDGNLIYGLTNKPYAPAHLVYIGVVVRSNSSNGEIFIQPQNGFELRELHDVSAQSPSNNNGIFYNSSNSLWETKSIATALGYTPANVANVVPYTGATTNVNLGANTLTALSVLANGFSAVGNSAPSGNSGYIFLKQGIGPFTNDTGYNSITANSTKFLLLADAGSSNNKIASFELGSLTNNTQRTYTLPDIAGTLALLEGTQTFTGSKTFYSGITSNNGVLMQIGGSLYGTGYVGLSAVNNGVSVNFPAGIQSTLLFNTTNGYNYTFPNATGTIALTSDIPSLANYVTLTTAQTITGDKIFPTGLTSFAMYTSDETKYVVPSGASALNQLYLSGALSGTSATFSGNSFLATSSGDVGVGTTTPNLTAANRKVLDINGTTQSLLSFSSGGTNKSYIFNDGTNLITQGATLKFQTGYTDRLTIASTGAATFSNDVSLDGAAGTRTLTIRNNTSGNAVLSLVCAGSDGGAITYNRATSQLVFANSSASNAMVITSGGNIGIGTTDVDSRFKAELINVASFRIAYNGTSVNYMDADNNIFRSGNGTEGMRTTSDGILLIGTTTTSIFGSSGANKGSMLSSGNINLKGASTGLVYLMGFFNPNGVVGSISTTGSVTSYNTSSDYRLKQDLKEYNGLELVSKIKTYDYEWKSDKTRAFGVMAHELAEVLPYAVQGEKDAEMMQSVDYSKIVPILVKAVQEQQAQIEELKAKINNLLKK